VANARRIQGEASLASLDGRSSTKKTNQVINLLNMVTICRQYDLRDITFEHVQFITKGGKQITVDEKFPLSRLVVPGLAEKRPSVLYSDSV
jgi:hypothetical protein